MKKGLIIFGQNLKLDHSAWSDQGSAGEAQGPNPAVPSSKSVISLK